MYAGTTWGVVKTTDSGKSWQFVGLGDRSVNELAIDPSDPATVYASAWLFDYKGIFKTTDGGIIWNLVYSGTEIDFSAPALAIDPDNHLIVYAGIAHGGLLKTSDGGATWDAMNAGLGTIPVYAIAIDRSDPSNVYAGTKSGVYKTQDGGGTWFPLGLPEVGIASLAIDPSDPATLYAGSWFPGDEPYHGIWISKDDGEHWDNVLPGIQVRSIVLSSSAPAVAYAGTGGGVVKSTNCGQDWQEINYGWFDSIDIIYCLAIDPLSSLTLYAANDYALYAITFSKHARPLGKPYLLQK